MSNTEVETSFSSLEAFPAVLRQQVQALPDAILRFKPENEWSVIENVGHLIDVEAVWMGRFRQMLAAENPSFPQPNVDELVRQHHYQQKDIAGLLHTFAEMRAESVAFLRGLKPVHLARPGVHPVRGPVTVANGITILARHDYLHAEQIEKTVGLANSAV